MIGRLKGVLLEKQPPNLLIDVQGVGYDVQAPMTTFYNLPEAPVEVVLHTHFVVSEVSQQLFGFIDKADRALFRLLIKVNGVGPKMALGVMSGMSTAELVRCVSDDNVTALVKVPGVGKKTAERLIIDMRDKLKDWSQDTSEVAGPNTRPSTGAVAKTMVDEAEAALVALGYKPAEAARSIAAIVKNQNVSRSEELIRLSLRSMMPA